MLLPDHQICAQIEKGRIGIAPYEAAMVQPSSLDIRLDRYFRLFDNHKYAVIDPAADQDDLTRRVAIAQGESLVLHPGEFVLASTYELVTLPTDIAARVEGKSSLGRLGLLTHATAGFVDPGFSGHITLELSNVATLPIKLYPGMKIGQLCFMVMSATVERPYGSATNGSHYQGQHGPTASRSAVNFHVTDVYTPRPEDQVLGTFESRLKFGRSVTEARKRCRLTRKKAARSAGLTVAELHDVEHGVEVSSRVHGRLEDAMWLSSDADFIYCTDDDYQRTGR